MTTEGPLNMPPHHQERQQLEMPLDRLALEEQDTASIPAAPGPAPAVAFKLPFLRQGAHTSMFGLPTHRPSITEQSTLSVPAVPSVQPSMDEQSTLAVPIVPKVPLTPAQPNGPAFLAMPNIPPVLRQEGTLAGPTMPGFYPAMPGSFPYQHQPQASLSMPGLSPEPPAGSQWMVPSSPSAFPERHTDPQPGMIQRLLRAGLTRLQEPQPEGLLTRGMQAIRPETRLGAVPLLAFADALGLFIVSCSYYVSVRGYSYPIVESCFLVGLLMMFVPNLVRVLSRTPTRLERIGLICILAGCSYFIQFMTSPMHFSGFDEFLHSRTADDILRTGHLFSENSMLPVSPFYPGLEIVTNAVSTTTGLSTFYAGNIVIAASRLLMVLALFLFYEHITSSSRMASIAVVIYMANPHFLFFDTLYNYETLSLPLAILMVYILARYGDADKNHRLIIVCAWLIMIAITITHHMTSYFFDGLLLLWTAVSFFRPTSHRTRVQLISLTITGLVLSVTYAFLLPGNPVWSYLSQYFGGTFTQLQQIITGSLVARPLFASSAQVAPVWDRMFMTGAVVMVTFTLPFGLLTLQQLHHDNALALTFGVASLSYPLTQAFRFTSFGTEITDRAAAFLFLPIAYMLTILITHFWPTRRLNRRAIMLTTSAITVIFLGGVIVGSGAGLSTMPGPYLVVGDARSVEPEGIEAAQWSLTYLGPNNRIAADRINQMLMSTYGDQRIVTRLGDNVDVAPIFYTTSFDQSYVALLQYGDIHYLVVDTRISTGLPLEGLYFENDRPTSVISRSALTKFATMNGVNRLFDSGDIVVYDTGPMLKGSKP